VVEHCETADGVKRGVGKTQGGGIADYDLGVVLLVLAAKGADRPGVELEGDVTRHLWRQPFGRCARTGTDLEHVVT